MRVFDDDDVDASLTVRSDAAAKKNTVFYRKE